MFGFLVQYLQYFLLLIQDFIYRTKKFFVYVLKGKHEVERICEAPLDIYEKTMQFDRWIKKTRCKQIQSFFNQHFGTKTSRSLPHVALDKVAVLYSNSRSNNTPIKRKAENSPSDKVIMSNNIIEADLILASVLRELTERFQNLIVKSKDIRRMSSDNKECMRNIIYRIISYRLSLLWAERFASTPYDSSKDTHTDILINLWNNLVKSEKQKRKPSYVHVTDVDMIPPELSFEIKDKSDIISNRWSHIGFQGEDPGTDFRGMGLLGLIQLEYLSRKPNRLARDLLGRSLNEKHSYPLAIVGINLTFNLLNLFRDESLKHLYYDTGDILFRNKERALEIIKIFNDIYVELFLRFDCFWHESKPETIFEFRELMDKFINIVRFDLSNRNFSLKFIY